MHHALKGFTAASAFLVSGACASPQAPASNGFASSSARTVQPTLQDRVMRGRQVVMTTACADCHGGLSPANAGFLVGAKSNQDTILAGDLKTYAANLTPHPLNGTGRYTERQIFNAMRYGLRPETTPDVAITSFTPGRGISRRSPTTSRRQCRGRHGDTCPTTTYGRWLRTSSMV